MVAKEEHKTEDIPDEVWKILENEYKIEKSGNEKIKIISSVFMNPLSIYIDDVEEYYYEFFKEMVEYADNEAMPEIVFKQITDQNNGDRIKVLWVENEAEVKKTKDFVLYKSKLGKYLDIDFYEYKPNNEKEVINKANAIAVNKIKKQYQVIILDLNLIDNLHVKATKDNTEKAEIIYKAIDGKEKVILFSKFFKEDSKGIINILDTNFDFRDQDRMISKPEKDKTGNELNPLINSIFKVFNQQP